VTVRSSGWKVRPSFSPHGPVRPVTLLLDEQTLTQLAGDDVVAWQTPWSAFRSVRLVKTPGMTTLYAEIDQRVFTWRSRRRGAFAELAPLVHANGGYVVRERSQYLVLVTLVLIAAMSFAGVALSSWDKTTAPAVHALENVNLSEKDLPGSWAPTPSSPLQNLAGTPRKVYTFSANTTTTMPSPTTAYGAQVRTFESCMHLSYAADREFGTAGHSATYQVASPTYSTTAFGGVQVVSVAQWYADPANVTADTLEMRNARFAACFANANADFVLDTFVSNPNVRNGKALTVRTFAHGFRVAGVATLSGLVSSTGSVNDQFFIENMTSGHYEVTMAMIVPDATKVRGLITTLTTALLSRMSPVQGTAA